MDERMEIPLYELAKRTALFRVSQTQSRWPTCSLNCDSFEKNNNWDEF